MSASPFTVTSEYIADLLTQLVDTPSVTGDEAAIAEWVHARLREAGGGEILRSGNSVVWRGPQAGRPLVVLAGHLDTVPPNGNEGARRKNGRIYGLGTTDMKSGDAVMLALVESLRAEDLSFDLAAVFYDAEEGPHVNNGLKRLLAEMPWLREAAMAVLLEPTDMRVEVGCNGAMNATVRVRGKSAHSARPWLGVNAIREAADWLAEITQFPVTRIQVGGVEFSETLQVTTMQAGRARNVVPDLFECNLNYRFPPDRTLDDAKARMRSLVPEAFDVEIIDFAAAGSVSTGVAEVKAFIEQFDAEVTGKQGWTDVAQFTEAGVPAFNFGPGVPELSHQQDEYCDVENLGKAYDWLSRYLKGATA
jgi:succinyl-diaminopimelate desuccinylase